MVPMLRRVSLGLALLAVTGGLTACGMRDTIDPVASAASKSADAGGVDVTLSVTSSVAGHETTINGHGSFDEQQGEMEVELPTLPLPGAGAAGGSLKEISLTESGDPVVYLSLPSVGKLLPGGKSWIRLDLQQAGKSLGVDVNQLLAGSGQNPTQLFELLKSEGDFSQVGQETIGGVSTTHYHGSVDLAKAAKQQGIAGDLLERLAALGAPTQLPLDVWVDDAGLVRQITENYDQTVAGVPAKLDMTIGLSNYGKDVNVSAPSADQVFDLTGIAQQAASAFGALGKH
jgi:hypothetical protein